MARLARRAFVLLVILATLAASFPSRSTLEASDSANTEVVAFNTRTYKFHCRTCSAARRCTRNCIEITRAKAKARGGVPCKICGGSCSVHDD